MNNLVLPPLGLYIHIPWCLKKCPYCDFNSHSFSGELPESDYVQQLLADLDHDLAYVQDRKLDSIFIGGGTPSLFSPGSIHRILEGVAKVIPFAPDIEITLEANPGTFETEKFARFREAGINRLSIGIQSFNPVFLEKLGRVHDGEEAKRAAAIATAAGFDNFNLDLMFGLPGQTLKDAMQDLETALAQDPTHLSWYQLTIEPNTAFYSRPPALPEDDAIAGMQDQGIQLLESHGLHRYEVSACSKTGKRSAHNMNYWLFGDYLGIGAGAHGKVTLPRENKIIRTRKTRQPLTYLEQNETLTVETLAINIDELPLEFMMNALRLIEGCEEALYSERTGLPLADIEQQLSALRQGGLLVNDQLATTDKGLLFLNSVLETFLPPDQENSSRIPVNSG